MPANPKRTGWVSAQARVGTYSCSRPYGREIKGARGSGRRFPVGTHVGEVNGGRRGCGRGAAASGSAGLARPGLLETELQIGRLRGQRGCQGRRT